MIWILLIGVLAGGGLLVRAILLWETSTKANHSSSEKNTSDKTTNADTTLVEIVPQSEVGKLESDKIPHDMALHYFTNIADKYSKTESVIMIFSNAFAYVKESTNKIDLSIFANTTAHPTAAHEAENLRLPTVLSKIEEESRKTALPRLLN